MAGGTGSRLWPLSREYYPKQFLTVEGNLSMLQQTFARLDGIEHKDPLLICNEDHRFIAAEQVRVGGFGTSGIILEPVGRNTAPAIALAALQVAQQEDEDPILLVLAADHMIEDTDAFQRSVNQAIHYAEVGHLVTFGIVPTAPETGYGYIKRGTSSDIQCGNIDLSVACSTAFHVDSFVEKPDLETAKTYLNSGDYYWNSGMFMFKASQYIAELRKHRPDILMACEKALADAEPDMDFIRVSRKLFELCPDDSIDYAVMEKTEHATVVPMDAGWNDVGSWSALWEVSEKNSDNNVIKGDIIAVNSTDNYLHADNKLIATVGIDNLIVVETKDAILVANKDQVQDVKAVVNKLKSLDRSEHKLHREVYRPWGKYDLIDFGQRDRVKRITVKPGEKLSIQKHHHRAEHWIVVAGTARVTNGDQVSLITEDQSTYIPLGTIHALENPGKIPLEMIEVQTGSYLGEDDIVRFEDRYGRS